MTTKIGVQVLIVGAGPTGLALACDLARRSVKFRIVDKASVYFIGSKGKGLQPRSLEVMDDFGIVDQIVRNGKFHLPFRGYDGAKILGERDPHEGRHPTPSTPYASPLLTPQWRVEEALRGLVERSGGQVELGTELVALAQDADSVTTTLIRDGRQELVRCQYLVAADGGKSSCASISRCLLRGKPGKTSACMWVMYACAGWIGRLGIRGRIIQTAGSRFARCLPRTSFSFKRRYLRAMSASHRLHCSGNWSKNARAGLILN